MSLNSFLFPFFSFLFLIALCCLAYSIPPCSILLSMLSSLHLMFVSSFYIHYIASKNTSVGLIDIPELFRKGEEVYMYILCS